MKIVISDPKSGRSTSMEIKEDRATAVMSMRIGEIIDGSALGMSGYKMKITGGSDASGFPLDRSIHGTGKVRVLRLAASSGKRKGQYIRSTVRGGIITNDTAQVNLAITEYGERPIDDIFGAPKGSEKREEPKKEEGK